MNSSFRQIAAVLTAAAVLMTAVPECVSAEDASSAVSGTSEEPEETCSLAADTYDSDTGMPVLSYLNRSWNGEEVTHQKAYAYEYTEINSDTTTIDGGVYAVLKNTDNGNRIKVTRDTCIILTDYTTLNASKGITVESGATLTICAGVYDTGTINITDPGTNNAGIGGTNGNISGSIVILGGTINVKGGNEAAGIGGGNGRSSGFKGITVYGGTITSSASRDASGIGSGSENSSSLGDITIYGGTIEATGKEYGSGIGGGYRSGYGRIHIFGGDITAVSDGSAGIGSGSFHASGEIIIDGGYIRASGKGGAGIGAGFNSDQSGTITVNGGIIEAVSTGGSRAGQEFGGGAGIGGGYAHSSGNIIINGGDVFASGVAGAGIGGGEGGSGGTTTINGGNVLAISCNYGSGIGGGKNGSGGTVKITGGSVNARGSDFDYKLIDAWGENQSVQWDSGTIADIIVFAEDFLVGYIESGNYSGAGIGGGYRGEGGNVTISGGIITAKSGDDAVAIGHGDGKSKNGTLNLDGSLCVELNGSLVPVSDRASAAASEGVVIISKCGHPEFEYTPVDGTCHSGDCLNCCYHIDKEAHHIEHRVCDECGYRDLGCIYGYSASISGDIGFNFHIKLSDEVLASDEAHIRITFPDGKTQKVMVSDIRDDYVEYEDDLSLVPLDTYHYFTVHLPAKNMSDFISFQIIDGDYSGSVYRIRFTDYASTVVYRFDLPENKKAKPLMGALLTYGSYAQMYFGYNTGDLAYNSIPEKDRAVIPEKLSIEHSSPVIENLPEGVSFAGAGMLLKSDTRLALYFKAPKNSSVTFRYKGEEITPVRSGSYLKVIIPDIMAYELGDDFTVNVGDGSVTYSPMNYCQSVLNGNYDDKLKDLIRSLYVYYQEAYKYHNISN